MLLVHWGPSRADEPVIPDDISTIGPNSVVLRRVVNTADLVNPSTAEAIIRGGLFRSISVAQGDTLSNIIAREYRDAGRYPAKTHALIAEQIAIENRLQVVLGTDGGGYALEEGTTIEIPDLPAAESTRGSKWICLPKFRVPLRTINKCDFSQTVQLSSKDSEVIQLRVVDEDVAESVYETSLAGYQVESAPWHVIFEGSQSADVDDFLTNAERLAIRTLLAARPVAPSTLFILDDGWPDEKTYETSRDFLLTAFSDVRQKFRLGESSLTVGDQTVEANDFFEEGGHSVAIRDALSTLTSLKNASAHVNVIFIPLFRTQVAAPLLRELVEIHLLARDMRTTLGIDTPTQEMILSARKRAKAYVSRLSTDSTGGITDQAVVQAAAWLGRLLSETSGRPFFMNFSWTVPNLQFAVDFPEDALGLYVSAAGNEFSESGETVFKMRRQLAYRSSQPGDVLAVMNVDREGRPDCGSSLLDTDGTALAVAFLGRVSSGKCGTSYAAPRVAWLIAARESTREMDRRANWHGRLKIELRKLIKPEAPDYKKIWFDVSAFYQGGDN